MILLLDCVQYDLSIVYNRWSILWVG